MLLITVATTALLPKRAHRLHVPGAHQQHRVAIDNAALAIDEDRAIAVAVERDAHPAVALDERRAPDRSGCVDPQSRLMFRPSGAALKSSTSKPSSSNSRGATVVVAPFAVSTASLNCPSRSGLGSASLAWAMYASMTSALLDRDVSGAADLPAGISDDRFDFALERLGELLAAARRTL